jgi:hypothetical protein
VYDQPTVNIDHNQDVRIGGECAKDMVIPSGRVLTHRIQPLFLYVLSGGNAIVAH